ncbi:MAG: CTP synthase [bacterium]|nr:CTP synthase [bacterium]
MSHSVKEKNTKYIFITGGVVSALGKGITSASVGMLLQSYGYKITVLKCDPYINVDPGTMSPYQHGEVFVTQDGAETDLDLGHYERFLGENLTLKNNITTGQVYDNVISKERRGEYLGKTVQVIPHITDEIKDAMHALAGDNDFVLVEIGGTVGDIESLPFLEAIRQFRRDVGRKNVLYMHLTLVPYIKTAGEVKTKPTQHSVGKLREIGIEPDILICRTENDLAQSIKDKLALFCNVEDQAVIVEKDISSCIYRVPLELRKEGLDQLILDIFELKPTVIGDLSEWARLVENYETANQIVKIAVTGKYIELTDAYKSIIEALMHAGIYHKTGIEILYIDVEENHLNEVLAQVDGILVPGGFGTRGVEGKVKVVQYAREKKIPFLGICLGMQCAVIDFSRNILGLNDANSSEFDKETSNPVIDLLEDQKKVVKKGGTMRLGAYKAKLRFGSKIRAAYGANIIEERHRHRYEFNNSYREKLESKGLIIGSVNPDIDVVESIELIDHPWFVAVQFHPEFTSKFMKPSPLFKDFIGATVKGK